MAESYHHPSPEIYTGLPAPTRRPVAQAAARLRDSCHACASSKVKCHKEKPSCSRCVNRGVTCEYFATKRPGRRRGNSTINIGLPSPPTTTSLSQLASNIPYTEFSTTAIASTDNASLELEPPDLLSNLVSPINSDPALSSALSLYTDQDDFFTSPLSFPEPETSLDTTPNGHDLTALSPQNTTFSIFREAFSDNDVNKNNLQVLSTSSTRAPLVTREASNSIHKENSSSPCCCLVRALGLMKHPFPNTLLRPTCTLSNGPESCSATEASIRQKNPDAQAIVAENQQTIEVISSILQCQCSQDGYLLAILTLIVFQVLGCYEAVAREPLFSSSSSSSGAESSVRERNLSQPSPSSGHWSDMVVHQQQHHKPGYCADGEDLGRMATQLILSKLHRVQRVVNQLSPKLKSQGTMRRDGSTVDSQASLASQMSGGGTTTSPFSALTSEHIEADLRKRLRGLSIEIIDMLRHA